jgi:hypothetical protein
MAKRKKAAKKDDSAKELAKLWRALAKLRRKLEVIQEMVADAILTIPEEPPLHYGPNCPRK